MNTIICTVCSTANDGSGQHPCCRGAAPLTDPELHRLLTALGDLLGAIPLTTETRP